MFQFSRGAYPGPNHTGADLLLSRALHRYPTNSLRVGCQSVQIDSLPDSYRKDALKENARNLVQCEQL